MFYHIGQVAARLAKLVMEGATGIPFWGRRSYGAASDGSIRKALREDHCAISNHSAAICHLSRLGLDATRPTPTSDCFFCNTVEISAAGPGVI